jgi:hypothetical protein
LSLGAVTTRSCSSSSSRRLLLAMLAKGEAERELCCSLVLDLDSTSVILVLDEDCAGEGCPIVDLQKNECNLLYQYSRTRISAQNAYQLLEQTPT